MTYQEEEETERRKSVDLEKEKAEKPETIPESPSEGGDQKEIEKDVKV